LTVRKCLKFILPVLIILLSGLAISFYLISVDISRLKKENPEKTSFMKYREKEARQKGKRYSIRQQWVSISKISPYLIKAVLIGEDYKFWRHEGFDYEAIQKAFEKDIKEKRFKFGGSTISQQLAKNLYLSPSKNPLRKVAEAVITWRIERVLTKRRILELYLNVIEWGDGIFGVEAASRHYFGKAASDLTPDEAARLAAVLPNPRRYNPLGNQRYVLNRSRLIYRIMIRRGIVMPEYREITGEAQDNEDNERIPIERLSPSD
jgi:monofunctional biosynthetic peptidoglycan transglycosylase